MRKKTGITWGLLLLVLALGGCTKEKTITVTPIDEAPTPYSLAIPKHFPTLLHMPEDNPLTVEGIALGRLLFYDGRLSGRTHLDSLMSCSTCHKQEFGFECGLNNTSFVNGIPHGLSGEFTPHTMLPLVNVVWNNQGYGWNGGTLHLEEVVKAVILLKNEIAGSHQQTVNTISSLPEYPPLFKKAFGSEEVTMDNIAKAISQFIRILVSSNSKFDRYLRGETSLTDAELRGYVLFTTEEGADCFHCHGSSGTPLFTTYQYYNNGKDSVFSDPFDRYQLTGNKKNVGAYKAPTLRNISYTAPYMHDGRFKTLDQVLDFYNQGVVNSAYIDPLMHKALQGGMKLPPNKLNDLKAFLLTLNDTSFISNTAFSNPKPTNPFFIH